MPGRHRRVQSLTNHACATSSRAKKVTITVSRGEVGRAAGTLPRRPLPREGSEDGNTKCVSCQLCEFVCPPKAIKIIPPGDSGLKPDRSNAEKMPLEFEINMLRCIFCGTCQEVCPEEAIFLQKDSVPTHWSALTREELIYNKEKLTRDLGGTHAPASRNGKINWRKRRNRKVFR